MTYVGWDGREYEDQERDNMREQHPCGIDCIDPSHDPEYDAIERAAFHAERNALGARLVVGRAEPVNVIRVEEEALRHRLLRAIRRSLSYAVLPRPANEQADRTLDAVLDVLIEWEREHRSQS